MAATAMTVTVKAMHERVNTCPRCGYTPLAFKRADWRNGVIVDQCPRCPGIVGLQFTRNRVARYLLMEIG